jgi:NADPH:quinone reductase-like Zn-dependent oxidoreductase
LIFGSSGTVVGLGPEVREFAVGDHVFAWAIVIAGVRKKQLDAAKNIGADQVVALDDQAAFDALPPVDIVANTVSAATAEQLVSMAKHGGMFASVIGVPESAKSRPSVRTVAFVSKQDPETLLYMAKAVRDGKLKIPISQQLPLREARQGHIALERGAGGKILLLP